MRCPECGHEFDPDEVEEEPTPEEIELEHKRDELDKFFTSEDHRKRYYKSKGWKNFKPKPIPEELRCVWEADGGELDEEGRPKIEP